MTAPEADPRVKVHRLHEPHGADPMGHVGEEPFFSRGAGFRAETTEPQKARVRATPYVYRDPKTIPPRKWLYGRHYVRGFVSTTIAPGGIGKTSLTLAEAVSMVSGRALLGNAPPSVLRVWVWNLEDPLDEIERRLAAVLLHYDVSGKHEVGDRLFVDTGRATPLVIATKKRDETIVAEPVVDDLIREMRDRRIDVLIIDPFVSSHAVPENDNGAIDKVAKTWARVAEATGAAVELVHHVRKPATGMQAPFTVDDARGAVALIGAVRSARVLNAMSDDEAAKTAVAPEQRRLHFRIDDGKANMRPPLDKTTWHKLISVPLDNQTVDDDGDWVGVVTPWEMPHAMDGVSAEDVRRVQAAVGDGEWAENEQANDWVGYAVARAMEIDINADGIRQRVKALLRAWIKGGALKVDRRRDMKKGREKPFVVVGARV